MDIGQVQLLFFVCSGTKYLTTKRSLCFTGNQQITSSSHQKISEELLLILFKKEKKNQIFVRERDSDELHRIGFLVDYETFKSGVELMHIVALVASSALPARDFN